MNINFEETLKSCVLYIHLTVQIQIVSRDITVLSLVKDLVVKIGTRISYIEII